MATNPVRTANGIMLFIPANGTNILPPGQGMAQYVGQQLGSSSNQPKRSRWVTAFEKFLKAETKTLGAIQILIGLIHIGFGGVSATLLNQDYMSVAISGYPFYAGLFFIASGSLSVSTAKHFNNNLMNCSLGMNITSAVMASLGIILCLMELGANSHFYRYASSSVQWSDNLTPVGFGIGVQLLFFSFLEFGITVSAAHFGCQATCCNTDMGMVVLPCTVADDGVTLIEANPVPPAYNTEDSSLNTIV